MWLVRRWRFAADMALTWGKKQQQTNKHDLCLHILPNHEWTLKTKSEPHRSCVHTWLSIRSWMRMSGSRSWRWWRWWSRLHACWPCGSVWRWAATVLWSASRSQQFAGAVETELRSPFPGWCHGSQTGSVKLRSHWKETQEVLTTKVVIFSSKLQKTSSYLRYIHQFACAKLGNSNWRLTCSFCHNQPKLDLWVALPPWSTPRQWAWAKCDGARW